MKDYYKEKKAQLEDAYCRLSYSVWHQGLAEKYDYSQLENERIYDWFKRICDNYENIELDGIELNKKYSIETIIVNIMEILKLYSDKDIVLSLPYEMHQYADILAYKHICQESFTFDSMDELNNQECIIKILFTVDAILQGYLIVSPNAICKYAYISDYAIVKKEFEISKHLYEELYIEAKRENDNSLVWQEHEGRALPIYQKDARIYLLVKEEKNSWVLPYINYFYVFEHNLEALSELLLQTEAIGFHNFIKAQGIEKKITYEFFSMELKDITNLPSRENGNTICERLRKIRQEFVFDNEIDFELFHCTKESGMCSGTCELCDYELMQINNIAKKLNNVKYPDKHFFYEE